MVTLRRLGVVADPRELFSRIADEPGAFFIDGGAAPLQGEPDRWTYFGSRPFAVVRSRPGDAGDPLDALQRAVSAHPPAPGEIPFTGGAVGYLSYDLKHRIERLDEPAARRETDDLWFGLHDAIAAWNVASGELMLVASGAGDSSGSGGESAAERSIDAFHRKLETRRRQLIWKCILDLGAQGLEWSAVWTRAAYCEAVLQLKELIAEGEIYQANLSQRFEVRADTELLDLWSQLRHASPAPYSAFLRCGHLAILSASPERFLARTGDRVETRPIKGTRPRGREAAEDARLAAELLAAPKDAAEHVMIVDLERNDLSRVCRPGSVVVPRFRQLESWAQVHHLVSVVEGRLHPGTGLAALLRATFPGGSITGAPKIRAMQLLDRIEPVRRGPYCGAAGWIGWSGDLDLQIAIRTLYAQGGRLWYQVGGGIVSDSDPDAEYEETLAKGSAIRDLLHGPSTLAEVLAEEERLRTESTGA